MHISENDYIVGAGGLLPRRRRLPSLLRLQRRRLASLRQRLPRFWRTRVFQLRAWPVRVAMGVSPRQMPWLCSLKPQSLPLRPCRPFPCLARSMAGQSSAYP